MLLRKYRSKADLARWYPTYMGIGGLMLAISIVVPRFFNIGAEFDFLAGLLTGLSLVLNLFGLTLLRWYRRAIARPDEPKRDQNRNFSEFASPQGG